MIKIDAQNVDFHYGDFHALKNISMQIEANTSVAFIGPSGCGKSTFLRLFNRMNDLIPDTRLEGKIFIDGRDIYSKGEKVDTLRKNVGMVFQKPNPFPKTIFENVAYGLRVNGIKDNGYIEETVVKSLKQVVLWDEVKDKLKDSAFALSGGQQQRLCIARALAISPSILLMDEPFGALDPIVRAELQRELKEIQRVLGTTILFVTHDVDEAFTLGDQVAVLSTGGHIEQVGTPTELLSSPASPFVAEFVGASRAARPVRVAGPGGLVVDDAGTPVGTLTTDEAGERP